MPYWFNYCWFTDCLKKFYLKQGLFDGDVGHIFSPDELVLVQYLSSTFVMWMNNWRGKGIGGPFFHTEIIEVGRMKWLVAPVLNLDGFSDPVNNSYHHFL